MDKLNLDKFIGKPNNYFTMQTIENYIKDFILRNALEDISIHKIPLKYFPESLYDKIKENLPEEQRYLQIDLEESFLQKIK